MPRPIASVLLTASTASVVAAAAVLGASAREFLLPVSRRSTGAYGVEWILLLMTLAAALVGLAGIMLMRYTARRLQLPRRMIRVVFGAPIAAFLLAAIFFR